MPETPSKTTRSPALILRSRQPTYHRPLVSPKSARMREENIPTGTLADTPTWRLKQFRDAEHEHEKENGFAHALAERFDNISGAKNTELVRGTEFRSLALDCIQGLKMLESHNRLLLDATEQMRQDVQTARRRADFETRWGEECEEEKDELEIAWARSQTALRKMTEQRDSLSKEVAEQAQELRRLKENGCVVAVAGEDGQAKD